MKKILIIVFCILLGVGVFFIARQTATQQKIVPPVPTERSSETLGATSVPEEVVINTPTRLVIPKIDVDTGIEHVGMDSEGKMGIPKDFTQVAWYTLGYNPGEKGSAVIAGHLDTKSGDPAVFYHLESLQPGDEVMVYDADGKKLVFTVTRSEQYPYKTFPLQEVFGAAATPRLNLISCVGTWNRSTQNYSHRTVVYTVAKT